jgi:hypothetical protein
MWPLLQFSLARALISRFFVTFGYIGNLSLGASLFDII